MLNVETQESCDLCGAPGRFYAKGKRCDILVCPACGLLWTNPLIYAAAQESPDQRYWGEEVYLANAEPQRQRFRRQLGTFLRKAAVAEPASLRALEVGCGFGFFLDACRERGVHAEGRDISARAVEFASRQGHDARVGTLDGAVADESYDAIFAFNLIEHLPHPRGFLVQCRRVLRPGGVLALETPTQESLFHRMSAAARWLSRGRLGFVGLSPAGHLCKLGKRSLRRVCGELGLHVVHQERTCSPFREIWGKSSLLSLRHKLVYRVALPAAWAAAWLTGQGNRLFVLLRKGAQDG